MEEKGISYISYCAPGTAVTTDFTEANDGVVLNTVTFTPVNKHKPLSPLLQENGEPCCKGQHPDSEHHDQSLPAIIFLPGLGSVIDNFRETLIALTEDHVVHYVETREKGSSKTGDNAGFSITDIGNDLPAVIEKLKLERGKYIICGYSLGATVAVSAFKKTDPKPAAVVLIEPSATFKWPWWLTPLARVGVPVYPILRPFLKWYMKKFRINKEGDYEMYEINSRILDQADPRKLAATVISVAEYEIWDDLATIDVPTLVIGVSQDRFHSHNEALEIASGIAGSTYIDIETNKRSHSAEVEAIIADYLRSINAGRL
jgi:pimeloyl-ACP methyl ester carboxylesterase